MSQQEPKRLDDDHEDRIKRHLSATRKIAENLEFDDELEFRMGLPDPERRTMLKAGSAVAFAGMLAGCSSQSEPEDTPPATEPTEEPTEDDDGGQAERSETIQMDAHQFEFAPQRIEVRPNTEVTIEFVKSTFEEQPDFNLHTWALTDGEYDVGPVNIPKSTDDDVVQSVTFVAEHEG
ncbi:MAG: nitrite reductase (NO-forming)/hydroxylamine reductase, partial [Natronomonas sp.]